MSESAPPTITLVAAPTTTNDALSIPRESESPRARIFTQLMTLGLTLILPQLVAMVSTVCRVVYRRRKRQLWWDDHFVVVALSADILYYCLLWVRVSIKGQKGAVIAPEQIVIGWVDFHALIIVLWSNRISITLCVARVIRSHRRNYRILIGAATFLALFAVTLLVGFIISCSTSKPRIVSSSNGTTTQTTVDPTFCKYNVEGVIRFLFGAGDIFGSVLVIFVFLNLVWKVSYQRSKRIRVYLAHTVTIVSCLLAIATVAIFLHRHRVRVDFVPQTLAALSFFPCNFAVVLTHFYNTYGDSVDDTKTLIDDNESRQSIKMKTSQQEIAVPANIHDKWQAWRPMQKF
ncbi:hypothetical protein FA15DRAFT_761407 [Coprinopsis marcescibilis]|uniref:Rhodopsin domain-containing protein n=1 Tax=Coprinopsis marcescibilis TaxID=230819 RepID=A0A5C3K9F7_COPMA|nr:hypothetical protein FA15DRAFT_761407 [Coprinopsis marcescibilis]